MIIEKNRIYRKQITKEIRVFSSLYLHKEKMRFMTKSKKINKSTENVLLNIKKHNYGILNK